MFRNLALTPNLGPENVFLFHPADLVAILEFVWDHPFQLRASAGLQFPPPALGSPGFRSDLNGWAATWFGSRLQSDGPPTPPTSQTGSLQPNLNLLLSRMIDTPVTLLADHLIYAYMVENTRVERIFRRVVHEFVHGEKLGSPSVAALHWLRNTEVLFFRDASPFFVSALQSSIRPDGEAIRRNAYQRMFGMDLNHGTVDGKPYSYIRAEAANAEFVSTFEELLRETWIGMINVNNQSGVRPIDDAKLLDLAQRLERMLLARRLNGTLAREEFAAVAMMSWFHLTLESNTPIVQALRAESTSPDQRLFKIAQMVGVPAHGLSASYFDIADAISRILLLIEAGAFTNPLFPSAVAGLYTPGAVAEPFMRTIITHWSIITGRDMKAGRIAPTEAARRPAELRAGPIEAPARANGQLSRDGMPQLIAEHV